MSDEENTTAEERVAEAMERLDDELGLVDGEVPADSDEPTEVEKALNQAEDEWHKRNPETREEGDVTPELSAADETQLHDPTPLRLTEMKDRLHEEIETDPNSELARDDAIELLMEEFGHTRHRVERALETLVRMQELGLNLGSYYRGTPGPAAGEKAPGTSERYASLPPLVRSAPSPTQPDTDEDTHE